MNLQGKNPSRGRWENLRELAVKGGPPVRGQKLLAWRVPPLLAGLASGQSITGPEGSTVAWAQVRLLEAARMALAAFPFHREELRTAG